MSGTRRTTTDGFTQEKWGPLVSSCTYVCYGFRVSAESEDSRFLEKEGTHPHPILFRGRSSRGKILFFTIYFFQTTNFTYDLTIVNLTLKFIY